MKYLITGFVIAIFIESSWNYPNGPSTAACVTLTPNHGASPQTSTSPYQIIPLKLMVENGESIQVEIKSNEGATFKGFFLQMRTNAEDHEIIGEFLDSENGSEFNFRNCTEQRDSVTHSNPTQKSKIIFQWKAPMGYIGFAHFQ